MSESKHTPGPWMPIPKKSGDFKIAFNEAECWVAEVFDDEDAHGRAEADARLIAAAPDMLEALEDVRKSFVWQTLNADTRMRVKLAISKAKGESK